MVSGQNQRGKDGLGNRNSPPWEARIHQRAVAANAAISAQFAAPAHQE